MKLKKKEKFVIDGNDEMEVLDVLGEGGQGEVYRVKYLNHIYALKVYKELPGSDFTYNLRKNINNKSPYKTFLWPKLYIDFDCYNTCGYLMDIRDKDYVSFVSYLTGKNKFKDLATKLSWCIELCKSFKELHLRGYSYQDLNDGNFFLNKDTGELLICDNDNVTADGRNLGVLGKMKYMAPEIVVSSNSEDDKDTIMPDIHSDRFSLAIILFLALCMGNPFEGSRLKDYDIIDEEAEYELFGSKPIFIYSDEDNSNRPIKDYHKSVIKLWERLPNYIQDEFKRTFVKGIKDRENERTTELEWIKALTRYRDELITCSCGEQYYYGYFDNKLNKKCPNCGKKVKGILTLHVNKQKIVLEKGKGIYQTHIDKYSSDYNKVIGRVAISKQDPSVRGIKLFDNEPVLIKDTTGNTKTIEKDGVIPVLNGLKIKFSDNVIGEIIDVR